MRRQISLAAMLLLAALPAFAGQILPRSPGRWSEVGGADSIDLGAYNSPSAAPMASQAILSEYGWVSTEPVSYMTGAGVGGDDVKVILFQMKDPTGGYGLYSYLRTPDMARANFSEHSSMSPDHLLVLEGNLVLEVLGRDLGRFQPELKSVVEAVSTHAQEGALPMLWQHLPEQNEVSRSDHYILGPLALNRLLPGGLGYAMGFETGAEGELAQYKVNGHEESLLIIDFPTPQLAGKQLAELQRQFNTNGAPPTGNSVAGRPALFAKRTGTLLAIVSGASDQADAESVLSMVQSGTEVTWNEPTFQFKEPSIEMMIAGTIVAAGLICLFAVIAGVSFGALRLVVKRYFPGKLFDRKNHLEVLQLGLGSKPINSDDFYGYSVPAGKATGLDKDLPDRVALKIFR